MEQCAECGYDYDEGTVDSAHVILMDLISKMIIMLADDGADVSRRRRPEVWSPLEYACHVRDVLLMMRERVYLTLRVDSPEYVPMGREERVLHDAYDKQDPVQVAAQLESAARMFAWTLGRLSPVDLSRTANLRLPGSAPQVWSLSLLAVITVHEARHHLLDIERQMASAVAPGTPPA